MSILLNRFKSDWAAWVMISYFALLPFGRLSEAPLLVFAFALPFLMRSPDNRRRLAALSVIVFPLFLCFWLPMVFSSFDSYAADTSSLKSLAALRYLAAALSISILLRRDSARWRVLRWTAYLLVFWAVDGFAALGLGPGFQPDPRRCHDCRDALRVADHGRGPGHLHAPAGQP